MMEIPRPARLMLVNIPFPVTVTWFQLIVGFFLAWILGECGRDFPKFAYFPPFHLSMDKIFELTLPTILYLGMITTANVLLANCPNSATYPIILSGAVVLHHASRFYGCGQVYVPLRWISVGIVAVGFLLAAYDPSTMGWVLLPLALAYATFSAIFRAWSLEKAMHVVEGRGNQLHNHQVVFGIVLLPILIVLTGEYKFWTWMPYDPSVFYYWQWWCCLITAGCLPFLKNIVANRLIRKTGQAPWRALELISIIGVFIIGQCVYGTYASVIGYASFLTVLVGRALGMLDVISRPDLPPSEPAPITRVRQRERRREDDSAPQEPPAQREAVEEAAHFKDPDYSEPAEVTSDIEHSRSRRASSRTGSMEQLSRRSSQESSKKMSRGEIQAPPELNPSADTVDIELAEQESPAIVDVGNHMAAHPLLQTICEHVRYLQQAHPS